MPEPRYSVQEYVAIDLPFADELDAFRRGGAQGIGLSFFTGPRAPRPTLPEMARALAESGLAVTACWPETPSILPIPGFPGAREPEERIRQLISSVSELAAVRPEVVGCVTGPAGGLDAEQAYDIVVEGLRAIARAASEEGLRVAIEPIHPSNADLFSIVSSLPEIGNLIADVGAPNVGIVFDMWHSWGDPELLDHIVEYRDKIALVHLSDWRDPTRSWCDRALPGEGVADVRGMLGALDAAGYDGWYELEVMSDDGTYETDYPDSLWRLDPESLVRRGRERFQAVWRSRTLERAA